MAGIAANQVQFKPKEPPDRTLPTLGKPGKDLVGMNPAVMAHAKWGGIDKTDPGAFSRSPGFAING